MGFNSAFGLRRPLKNFKIVFGLPAANYGRQTPQTWKCPNLKIPPWLYQAFQSGLPFLNKNANGANTQYMGP